MQLKMKSVISIGVFLFFRIEFAKADCWEYAGKAFNISPQLLFAIAQQESSLNPKAIRTNSNGTLDIGLMQINSYHLPRLKKFGIDKVKLKEPCTSVIVGASILADMMARYGYSWEAVGAYNVGINPHLHSQRMVYARKVWSHYVKLTPHSLHVSAMKEKTRQ